MLAPPVEEDDGKCDDLTTVVECGRGGVISGTLSTASVITFPFYLAIFFLAVVVRGEFGISKLLLCY